MSPAYHRAGVMAPQRHVLRWVIIAVLVVVGIAALRQATMNQPDPPRAEEGTTVELDVRTNGSRLSLDAAATGLWAACASVVDEHELVDFSEQADGDFALRIEPALGHHAQARLVGCLEDVTVPRILGNVTRIEHR